MKIGFITINYNNTKDTKEFLESFAAQKNKDFAVFVSDQSDKEYLPDLDYPFVRVKRLPNKGYAFGVNRGLEYFSARGVKHFCVINNDVDFSRDFVQQIKRSFERFDVFGAKIYYKKGYEYHKRRYKRSELGKVLWYAGGVIDWQNVYTKHRGVDEVDRGQYDQIEETEFITGCFFCFNKKVFDQVGFWDEGYFLYYEDADFSVRVRRKGFFLIYNPEVFLYHKNAQSTQGSGSSLHQRFQRKGRLRFALKYADLKTRLHVFKNYLLGR